MTSERSSPHGAAFDVPGESGVQGDDTAGDDHEISECPYCGRPFRSTRRRDLHLGEVHGDALDGDQRDAYEKATDAERDELWLYHFKAVVMLLVIYMATGLLYLIVLSG